MNNAYKHRGWFWFWIVFLSIAMLVVHLAMLVMLNVDTTSALIGDGVRIVICGILLLMARLQSQEDWEGLFGKWDGTDSDAHGRKFRLILKMTAIVLYMGSLIVSNHVVAWVLRTLLIIGCVIYWLFW